jgi:hypothetical protein
VIIATWRWVSTRRTSWPGFWGEAIDYARQGQLEATRSINKR